MNNRELGRLGEAKALDFVQALGMDVKATNFTSPFGEIDIIAKRDNQYHFFEVKTRKGLQYGLPRESLTKRKQLHIKRTAMSFMAHVYERREPWDSLHFNVIEIYVFSDGKTHIELLSDAF